MLTLEIYLHLVDLLLTAIVVVRLFLYVMRYWDLWAMGNEYAKNSPTFAEMLDYEEAFRRHLNPYNPAAFVIPLTLAIVLHFYDFQQVSIVLFVETVLMFILKARSLYFFSEMHRKVYSCSFRG